MIPDTLAITLVGVFGITGSAIVQILILDLVFSIDSIITAVGMTPQRAQALRDAWPRTKALGVRFNGVYGQGETGVDGQEKGRRDAPTPTIATRTFWSVIGVLLVMGSLSG